MKKYIEYIILGIVAAGSILYIGLREKSDINYKLPDFRLISRDDFTKIEISGNVAAVLEFVKEADGWILTDGKYPAESGKINKLLDAVEEVVPVDLVSQAGSHSRYDLDDETKIVLKAWNGDRLIREIDFGKLSTSGNYNYVLFPGDKNVYTLRGNLSTTLESPADDFRDKKIFQLNRNDIIKLAYSDPAGGLSTVLTKSGDDQWIDETGTAFDSTKVSTILGTLSSLHCTEYLDSPPSGTGITIKVTTSTENVLTLYSKKEAGYPASSSAGSHPFLLTAYTGDTLIDAFTSSTGPLPGLGGDE